MSSKKRAVGFISSPGWLDPTPDEFRALTKGTVAVQQTFPDLPNFDYRTDSLIECEPQLIRAAQQLAGVGCSIIAVVGTPFGFVGYQNMDQARARLKRMQAACGVECLSSIAAIIETLDTWQVRKVALACTYYPQQWRDAWAAFVTNSGFEVLSSESLIDHGMMAHHEPHEIKDYPAPEQITGSALKMANDFPAADVIVINGSGSRTLAITDRLRDQSGKRILAADTALYSKLAKTLDIDITLTL